MRSTVLLSTTDLERLGSTHSTQYNDFFAIAFKRVLSMSISRDGADSFDKFWVESILLSSIKVFIVVFFASSFFEMGKIKACYIR